MPPSDLADLFLNIVYSPKRRDDKPIFNEDDNSCDNYGNAWAATFTLWEQESGMPLPTGTTTIIMEEHPLLNTTKKTDAVDDTTATRATGEDHQQQQQQQQTTPTTRPRLLE